MKFKDADLLGLPWRITVGAKGLKEGRLELKRRNLGESSFVAFGDVQTLRRALHEASS